jgi:protein involved in polysaccharide export with SLBB domain
MPAIRLSVLLRSSLAVLFGCFVCFEAAVAQLPGLPGGKGGAGGKGRLEEPGGVEAALMSGNLGNSGEATNLPAGSTGMGLSSGVTSPVGGLGANQGKASVNQTAVVGSGTQGQILRSEAVSLPSLPTTQFQRFVQEATGRNLPLFGYSLFERPRFPSVSDAPVPAAYVVGPGDEIDLKIWGGVDVAIRLPVDRNGQVTVPRVGPITVAGTRASDLDALLKKQIGKVFVNFELSATIGKLRTIQIYVVGQARAPGAYTVSSLSTLVSAVFESGGPSATGSMRRIELMRGNTKVSTLDLYSFIQSGDVSGDARLLPGDVIVVPPAGPRVALTGAVDNPYIFELATSEEPIRQVLAYGGSSITLTTPHKVLVERVDNRRSAAPREVQERLLDEAGLKSTLRDGDVLTLLSISPQFANAVTLRGNVAEPLRYAHKAGMRVSDLIPEAEALIVPDYYAKRNILVQYESGRNISADRSMREAVMALPQINWAYASISRLESGEVRTRLIPFNLGLAVKQRDPVHDLLLEPGDVVTVFSVNELAVPRDKRLQYVKIDGEVNSPGVYEVRPGETLTDIVQRAGGFAKNAYVYGTVFTRETTRAQQQANLDAAIRRMEAQVASQATTNLQNLINAADSQSLQAQLAAQRMTLDRLRNLKASGRIALELEPGNRARLPRITLEDGDVIEVPAQPSFVAVFGAVYTENSFLHRDGLVVKDYIERAGLMRDSDVASAMLIRADGTVRASTAQHSLFGFGESGFLATRVFPGDSIFVPERLDKRTQYTKLVQSAKDVTQLFFQFGLGAAAVRTLRN